MAGTISDDFSELLYVLTLWLAVYSRQKVLEPLKQKVTEPLNTGT